MPTLPLAELMPLVEAVNEAMRKGYPGQGQRGPKKNAVSIAAKALGMHRVAAVARLETARAVYGVEPDWSIWQPDLRPAEVPDQPDPVPALKERIRVLETELKSRQREDMTREAIRESILKLKSTPIDPPKWTQKPARKSQTVTGIPTLLCSDWHWGEVVKPSEVNWCNEYNLEIAHKRAKKLVDTSLSLLFDRMKDPNYPGAVICLGGDMVSGNIHEELTATNDVQIMPCVVDLIGVLKTVIDRYLERFPALYIVGVTGNHGRTTRKPIAKERAATNFDWLVYQMLALHYANNRSVVFNIPDGPDCYFNIYGHRYCLTHGDQFRGGDGITGAIMPIIRGRHKKASRDTSMGQSWDTIIMGHWHTLIQLPHAIVNSSLKGLDEYAFAGNFGFERAAQALWITHPENGITFQMPVYVDERIEAGSVREWVSWPKAA